MFLDEIRLAMAMAHRNIVETFDAGSLDGKQYMVMELVEGSSLRALLNACREPLRPSWRSLSAASFIRRSNTPTTFRAQARNAASFTAMSARATC
jgi:serine/threonine protein kinase